MAYADQKAGPGRIVAIAVVALLHVLIGYAFISGLAYKYVKKQVEDLDTFDIVEPPPPPEEVPPPPPPLLLLPNHKLLMRLQVLLQPLVLHPICRLPVL